MEEVQRWSLFVEQSSEQSVQHEEFVQYGGSLTLRAREQLGRRERSSSAKRC